MFNQPYLLKHPELFQYVIGIRWSEFNELLPKFSLGDLGYMGADDLNPHLKMILPQKKPPGRQLTDTEKLNQQNLDLPFKTIACIYNFTRTPG